MDRALDSSVASRNNRRRLEARHQRLVVERLDRHVDGLLRLADCPLHPRRKLGVERLERVGRLLGLALA